MMVVVNLVVGIVISKLVLKFGLGSVVLVLSSSDYGVHTAQIEYE